jgi:hypothetical protein
VIFADCQFLFAGTGNARILIGEFRDKIYEILYMGYTHRIFIRFGIKGRGKLARRYQKTLQGSVA